MPGKLIPVITSALLLFGLVSCSSEDQTRSEIPQATTQKASATEQTRSGRISFAAADLSGQVRQSSEWIGQKPVVLNFWGTWCPPCRREIPELVKLYDEYKDQGIEIVSLAINDTPAKVDNFSRRNGMNWTMLMADRQLSIDFKVTGVPTTIFFDRNGDIVKVKDYNGRMVERFVGPRPYEVFKQAFDAIL